MFCKKCGYPLQDSQKFCPKCGSKTENNQQWSVDSPNKTAVLSEQTVFLPPNEPPAVLVTKEAPASKSGHLKKAGILAVILSVVLIITVAGGIIIAKNKGTQSAKHNRAEETAASCFASYLNNTLIPEKGLYDPNRADKSAEGIYSAVLTDFDKDGQNEFVVAYTEKNGENIDFHLACYQYAEKEPEDSCVELIGNYTPVSDENAAGDSGACSPNQKELSLVEAGGKTYILFESLKWQEVGREYVCHVYTVSFGKFTEIANISVPWNGEYFELVCSSLLPEEMQIAAEDSAFDAIADSEHYTAASLKSQYAGMTLLYGQNNTVSPSHEYTPYYHSVNEAVCGFLKYFGMERTTYLNTTDNPNNPLQIDNGDKDHTVFHYVFFTEYEENGIRSVYEFTDYSDTETIINGADKENGD